MPDSMEVDALEQFLSLPPPPKAVKLLKMITNNLVNKPDDPRFKSILVNKTREKFEKHNVPWAIVLQMLMNIGFSPEMNADGRIEVKQVNVEVARSMLQVFNDFKQQKKILKNVEVQDDEILRAMHQWDLPPQIEAQLKAMIDQIHIIWMRQGDLVSEFYKQSTRSAMDRAVIKIAMQTLVKNHINAQLKNWKNEESMLHNIPEFNSDYLLAEKDGKTGVLTLIEEVISSDLNAKCFQKAMYASAQQGKNDMQYIMTCAAGRKVALVQFTNGLLELYTTYRAKLNEKTVGLPPSATNSDMSVVS